MVSLQYWYVLFNRLFWLKHNNIIICGSFVVGLNTLNWNNCTIVTLSGLFSRVDQSWNQGRAVPDSPGRHKLVRYWTTGKCDFRIIDRLNSGIRNRRFNVSVFLLEGPVRVFEICWSWSGLRTRTNRPGPTGFCPWIPACVEWCEKIRPLCGRLYLY